MKLYHLSSDNRKTKLLFPRVPDNLYQDEFGNIIEDSTTERICWSRTIGGAFRAIADAHGLGRFTVYSKEFEEKDITYPTKKQVPDCKLTKEVWTKKECLVEREGFIRVYNPTVWPLSKRIRWYFTKNEL